MIKKILYISYDGMTDPLGQSQVIPYLKGLTEKGNEFTILSFEKNKNYSLNKNIISKLLFDANIRWEPRKYTSFPPVFSTVKDVWVLIKTAKKLHKLHQFDIVHCRSYISALAGLYLKKKYGVKFVFDMRGFWPDERIDGNIWSLSNPIFKFIYEYFKNKELEYFTNADYTISLTETGKNEIHSWERIKKQPIPIEVIPCCADFNHFNHSQISDTDKVQLKQKLNINNNSFIISYLGSIGTWYMLDEMLDFFKVLLEKKSNAVFLFITMESPELINETAQRKGIPEDAIRITSASRGDVPLFLSISTVSLFFIKPLFSKKASSPTKMAEILGMGIPVITNTNVGDVDVIINESDCGLLVNDFTTNEYSKVIDGIDDLIAKPKDKLREIGLKYFSLEKGIEKYDKVYCELLDH